MPTGLVFTHELSEAEASSGMLSADDDLVLWAVFAAAPGGLPLAGGGVAGTTTEALYALLATGRLQPVAHCARISWSTGI